MLRPFLKISRKTSFCSLFFSKTQLVFLIKVFLITHTRCTLHLCVMQIPVFLNSPRTHLLFCKISVLTPPFATEQYLFKNAIFEEVNGHLISVLFFSIMNTRSKCILTFQLIHFYRPFCKGLSNSCLLLAAQKSSCLISL